MSAVAELNWLDREQEEIQEAKPTTDAEKAAWWYRLANWWHRRDLSFGDGAGMIRECTFRAEKILAGKACEDCGKPATTVETFDRAKFLCDDCKPQEFNR